jgi:hypothetical protein
MAFDTDIFYVPEDFLKQPDTISEQMTPPGVPGMVGVNTKIMRFPHSMDSRGAA